MKTNKRFLQRVKYLILSICIATIASNMKAEAQSPVSFQAKGGVGVASFWGKYAAGKAKFAYKVGAVMEYAFNDVWALQPSLNFVSKGCKDEEEGVGKVTMNQLYLELPVMMTARLNLTENSNLIISAGPYVACGVGGKTSAAIELMVPSSVGFETVVEKYKLNTFGNLADGKMGNKRFDGGIALNVAYENRHIILGAEGQLGFVNVNDEVKEIAELAGLGSFTAKNISAFVTVGYKF